MDHPVEPRVLTPAQIDRSLAELAPDAIACIERALRGTQSPNRTVLDTTFRVLDLARGYEAPELDTPEVEELRNVLTLVGE